MQDQILINFIVDRSGSMSSRWEEVRGGLKSYIEDQAKEGRDKAWFTLTTFDTVVDTPYAAWDVTDVPSDRALDGFSPRGSTALLDAVGQTIHNTEDWVKSNANWFSGKVLVIVFTDGFENASRVYTKDRIKEMIGQKEADGWIFSFFGANQDAWAEAQSYGISTHGTTQSVGNYKGATADSYAAASAATTVLRGGGSYNVAKDESAS